MNKLAGRYNLESHGTFDHENVFVSTAPEIQGQLIYSIEGYLSVLILFKKLPVLQNDILAYSGRYEVHDNVAIHHFDICNNPARIGNSEKRDFSIDSSGVLTLQARLSDGRLFQAVWRRDDI
jgi:hypothetical protein